MDPAWLRTLVAVTAVSLLSTAGALALLAGRRAWRLVSLVLVAFAIGGLLGDVFLHLLPESFERLADAGHASMLALAGVGAFFGIDVFLRYAHESRDHQAHPTTAHGLPALAVMNLVGDGLHNFVDGILIAASFLVSAPIGYATTLAVVLHEVPQEIGDVGVLVHAGLPPRRAIAWNLLSAAAAIAGALLTLLLGGRMRGFAEHLLPFTAGGFLYVACAVLIPEVQHAAIGARARLLLVVPIAAGVGAMALLR